MEGGVQEPQHDAAPGSRATDGAAAAGRSKGKLNFRDFAVHAVFWRRAVDWSVRYIPDFLYPALINLWATIFFCFSGSARRAVAGNLGLLLPGSSQAGNLLRAWIVFRNYAWSITESAIFRLRGTPFQFELVGEEFLRALADAPAAIILTAHTGNYDLGAALFAEKFSRKLHMVRAPEPDAESARYLDAALKTAPGLQVDYNTRENLISFDLLGALREGEIVSIQGDRIIPGVVARPATVSGQSVPLPEGPFILGYVADVPIFPLFVTRAGPRRYRVTTLAPTPVRGAASNRDAAIQHALDQWADTLGIFLRANWSQWFAFVPLRGSAGKEH